MEHVYDILFECRRMYKGNFSILEFGTNEGYAFTKILYATKHTKMEDRVTVHAFDTFEGMPASEDQRDMDVIFSREQWVEGQYRGGYEELDEYCKGRYSNYVLHKGLFEDALAEGVLRMLADRPPILVWFDCDYYSSTRSALVKILPYLPSGCTIYFDEFYWNYGSRFTGEARVVHELNAGEYGEGIELILDTALSLDSKRVYRFVRFEGGPHYELVDAPELDPGRPRGNDSPLP